MTPWLGKEFSMKFLGLMKRLIRIKTPICSCTRRILRTRCLTTLQLGLSKSTLTLGCSHNQHNFRITSLMRNRVWKTTPGLRPCSTHRARVIWMKTSKACRRYRRTRIASQLNMIINFQSSLTRESSTSFSNLKRRWLLKLINFSCLIIQKWWRSTRSNQILRD